ncbi:hypothetical protein LT679_13880 [Mucilaginibacter roseus]|uniref:LPXTG cell wall anchor domain-containing protein n=1 Tax=Mucilaginibacter roseus TaxID=1528868 RepID=A0ABS8U734_9SPHI|nr:hypothetical protein [Mucilaginibacter roseus]MCD8741699.1 hypothetical protein [Mucilaginibacter roseus]
MKKIASLILGIMAFSFAAGAQELKPVKIDSVISVNLPVEHEVKDTLGQKIYSGSGSLGYIVVIRSANGNAKPLKKEKDLNNVFKEYITKVQGQSSGSVLNARDTTIGNLKAKVFGLEADNGNGVEIRDFAVIYTKDATYTFEYMYPESRKGLVKAENKTFFSSIKASNELQRTDQYVNTEPSGVSQTGKIALYGGGALALGLIAFFLFRKREETALS